MEPERLEIVKELKKLGYEKFEPYIYKYCYLSAEYKKISLDWNGVFAEYYRVQAERIIENIKLYPEVFIDLSPDLLMTMRDCDFNRDLLKYTAEVEKIEKKINYDYTCGRCKSAGVTITRMLLRSLDEGKSSVFQCVKCDNKWVEN